MNESVQRLEDGRVAVRFERSRRHPRERVWTVLTEPDQLRAWFVDVLDYDRSSLIFGLGAELTYVAAGDVVGRGQVTAFDPPSLLEYTWDAEVLRWELTEQGAGCRLIFTNVVDGPETAAAVADAWPISLDRIAARLEGVDARS